MSLHRSTLLSLSLLILFPLECFPATYSVNATDDIDDGACTIGHCSFREAIIAANAAEDADLIEFSFLTPGNQVITPSADLPIISEQVIIDGATHPDGMVYLCPSQLPTSTALELTHDTTIYAFGISCPLAGGQHTLTVGTAGSGSGTVSSTPAGIDCGADCSEAYDAGSVVTLTATPDPSSAFTGWSGDADCSDGSVTVGSNITCTAHFDSLQHTLSVTTAGSGSGTVSSTPAGIDCGADCSEAYDAGSVVTLTATPDPSSAFTGWSGDADCSDGSVTVDADTNCVANFVTSQHTLTVGTAGSGSGTVSSTPAGIDCGADCSEAYDAGSVVTLTATPDPSSAFTGWSGDADCSDGSVTVGSNITCTAHFDSLQHTLSVTTAGSGSGTVSSTPAGIDCGADCSEAYDAGSVVTLTATPDPSSAFTGWSGDADCSDGSVTVDADTNCVANFVTSQHILTVGTAGSGSGTVSSTPAGIDCGADCSEAYDAGSVVTLTATPDPSSAFTGWSGDADCSDGSVTVDADTNCVANFVTSQHTLSVTTAGSGSGTVSSTPAGIDCGADCSEAYDAGSVVTLTATPGPSSAFTGWSGDADCTDGVLSIDTDTVCTATFTTSQRTLTVSKAGGGSGTVTSTPAGIDCGTDCTEAWNVGTVVTLTAAPDADSEFSSWGGDVDCADGSVTLDVDITCTANFTSDLRTLTVTKAGGGNGTITSNPAGIDCGTTCAETWDTGTVVTLIATPDTNSAFSSWTGHADCTDGSVTLNADTTCTANFTSSFRTLSVNKAGGGNGTVLSTPSGIDCGTDCAENYPHKATVDLLAMPDPGSIFAGWSGDSDCADGSVTLKKSASCTAEFGQAGPVILVVGVTGNGSVTSTPAGINCGADCTETWDAGTVVALTATAHSGSFFTGWSGDSDCSDGSVTLSASTSCHASFSGSPPGVTIHNPSSGTVFSEHHPGYFAATAFDSNGQDISPGIAWVSSKDGPLGNGAAMSVVLSKGNHVISASASDAAGNVATDSISVRIRPEHLSLTGLSIDTEEIYEARISITASNVTVLPSGVVTLSAGEIVAIGDGFAVEWGGSLTVGTDPGLAPQEPSLAP